eukprot:9493939-Pyramimonas_sp.AAC.1
MSVLDNVCCWASYQCFPYLFGESKSDLCLRRKSCQEGAWEWSGGPTLSGFWSGSGPRRADHRSQP